MASSSVMAVPAAGSRRSSDPEAVLLGRLEGTNIRGGERHADELRRRGRHAVVQREQLDAPRTRRHRSTALRGRLVPGLAAGLEVLAGVRLAEALSQQPVVVGYERRSDLRPARSRRAPSRRRAARCGPSPPARPPGRTSGRTARRSRGPLTPGRGRSPPRWPAPSRRAGPSFVAWARSWSSIGLPGSTAVTRQPSAAMARLARPVPAPRSTTRGRSGRESRVRIVWNSSSG